MSELSELSMELATQLPAKDRSRLQEVDKLYHMLVSQFFGEMLNTLLRNAKKGGISNVSLLWLLDKLHEETSELDDAIRRRLDTQEELLDMECADVALVSFLIYAARKMGARALFAADHTRGIRLGDDV